MELHEPTRASAGKLGRRIGWTLLLVAGAPAAQEGELAPFGAPGQTPVGWAVPEGYTIVEGDMIVPEAEAALVRQGLKANYEANLWPGGVVPFAFDATMDLFDQANAVAAMQDWEDVTALDFRPLAGDPNFILIRNSDNDPTPACNSFIGMIGGQQVINVTGGCLATFSMHHELAHALGYRHEQSRADRDVFVTINWCNIQGSNGCGPNNGGFAHNFQIAPAADHYGPYDFDSVMHYPDWAFADCDAVACGEPACQIPFGCNTIDVNPPFDVVWQNAIGQRDHLSVWDAQVMSYLYPEDGWRFLDPAGGGGGGTGTFLDPWDTTLSAAVDATPVGGELIVLDAGSFAPLTIDRAITLRAPMGGLVVE